MKNLFSNTLKSPGDVGEKVVMCTHIAACAYIAGMAVAAGCELDIESILRLNRHNCGLFTDAELTAAFHTAVLPLQNGAAAAGNNITGT